MKTEILVALLTGLVAVISAVVSLWGQFRVGRLNRDIEKLKLKAEVERNSARYREPLVRAAADLQSRLFNILALNFIDRFLKQGTNREQAYALANTAFLFAQFFAWTEATRLEIQYIQLDEDKKTQALSNLQSRIYSLFQTDRFPPVFRVFAGEQRAIGERMLVQSSNGLKCLGYGEFLSNSAFSEDLLMKALLEDVASLKHTLSESIPRLTALQHALVELIDFLDPGYLRFSKEERTKYADK